MSENENSENNICEDSDMYTERRKHQRKKPNCSMIIEAYNDQKIAVDAIDISEGGLKISSKEKLVVNSEYDFVIYFEDSRIPIRAKSRIVWLREDTELKGFQAGIQFLNITQKDLDRIFMLVQFDGFAYL